MLPVARAAVQRQMRVRAAHGAQHGKAPRRRAGVVNGRNQGRCVVGDRHAVRVGQGHVPVGRVGVAAVEPGAVLQDKRVRDDRREVRPQRRPVMQVEVASRRQRQLEAVRLGDLDLERPLARPPDALHFRFAVRRVDERALVEDDAPSRDGDLPAVAEVQRQVADVDGPGADGRELGEARRREALKREVPAVERAHIHHERVAFRQVVARTCFAVARPRAVRGGVPGGGERQPDLLRADGKPRGKQGRGQQPRPGERPLSHSSSHFALLGFSSLPPF